jgi:hypothetical protein
MDLSAAFKTEVYRPVVTVVIPAVIALTPWMVVVAHAYPKLLSLAATNQGLFAVLCLLLVVATGFLLEDIGSRIEADLWERLQGDRDDLYEEWHRYLRLAFVTEPQGQKYLGTIVMRLKFELSTSVALFVCASGCVVLRVNLGVAIPWFVSSALVALGVYLLWESYCSSKLLRKVRHELLKDIKVVGNAT